MDFHQTKSDINYYNNHHSLTPNEAVTSESMACQLVYTTNTWKRIQLHLANAAPKHANDCKKRWSINILILMRK